MQKKTLIYSKDLKNFEKNILIFDSTEQMRILANPLAWKIMRFLSNSPSYSSQVAKELKIYEQSAYYYINKLADIGAIKEVGISRVRGGTARLYQPSSPAFGVELDWGEKELEIGDRGQNKYEYARKFFSDYIIENSFDGLIIVGAPTPHGPYKSSARDGHYAVHLAFFLGTISSIPPEFVVKLDADAKAEKVLDGRNLISIGGPGTNIITAEFNRFLPIKFDESNFWSGLVEGSAKLYNLDNQGLIAKIKNPYSGKGSIIIVAGVRSIGTKSAVIALTNYSEEILKKYNEDREWAIVVQGFDMNADGKIDHVDILTEVAR